MEFQSNRKGASIHHSSMSSCSSETKHAQKQ